MSGERAISLGESLSWVLSCMMCRTTALPRVKPANGIAIHPQVENLGRGALEHVEWSIWKTINID